MPVEMNVADFLPSPLIRLPMVVATAKADMPEWMPSLNREARVTDIVTELDSGL